MAGFFDTLSNGLTRFTGAAIDSRIADYTRDPAPAPAASGIPTKSADSNTSAVGGLNLTSPLVLGGLGVVGLLVVLLIVVKR